MVETLLRNNRQWAANRLETDPDYFSRLVNVQTPRYLWIGCSDSRVPANVIVGLEPGEVFVHRNVANVVHPSDLNCLSVLQYAVDVLQVTRVIVCGHYGCGGVRAALEGVTDGLLPYWLRPIGDIADREVAELRRFEGERDRVNRLCELNVVAQVRQVSETPIMQNAWRRGQDVEVHGLIYDLADGLLRDLNCTWPPRRR